MWLNNSFQIHRLSWMFPAAYVRYLNQCSKLCEGRSIVTQLHPCLSRFGTCMTLIIPQGGTKSQHRDLGCQKKLFISPPRELRDEQNKKSASENHGMLLLGSQTFCSCSWLHQLAQTYLQSRKSSPWLICRTLNIASLADQDEYTKLKIEIKGGKLCNCS